MATAATGLLQVVASDVSTAAAATASASDDFIRNRERVQVSGGVFDLQRQHQLFKVIRTTAQKVKETKRGVRAGQKRPAANESFSESVPHNKHTPAPRVNFFTIIQIVDACLLA